MFRSSRRCVRVAVVLLAMAGLPNAAPASIIWDWTAGGGAHTGTFTTADIADDPLPAGSYTITDVTFLTSSFMRLGSYPFPIVTGGATPPYAILWDGLAVTNIDASSHPGVNGLYAGFVGDTIAIFGADRIQQDGPNFYEFDNELGRESGEDLLVTPRLPPDSPTVPEPPAMLIWTVVGLATSGLAWRRVR